MSVWNYERYHRINSEVKHNFWPLPRSLFFIFICTLWVKYVDILQRPTMTVGRWFMSWVLQHWRELIDGVIQLSQGNWRMHVWLQYVRMIHWQRAKMATRGWGWLGSVAASGPWPHWEWAASEGNWGAALRHKGERDGPPGSLCYLLLTECNNRGFCESRGRRDSECTERRRKQEGGEEVTWK